MHDYFFIIIYFFIIYLFILFIYFVIYLLLPEEMDWSSLWDAHEMLSVLLLLL